MKLINLITPLFKQGLGEVLVLHVTESAALLGFLVYEKGRLVIKDQKFLASIKPSQLTPCWENGVVGMICDSKGHEWQSLTFYGLERCNLKVDLEKTRHGALAAAENQYGDNLLDFVGSIYRGYQLMLDNHFLPVVMLKPIQSVDGVQGLAVCDLRAAPMSLSVIRSVNAYVRKAVEKHLVLEVQDADLTDEQFSKLFENYLPNT